MGRQGVGAGGAKSEREGDSKGSVLPCLVIQTAVSDKVQSRECQPQRSDRAYLLIEGVVGYCGPS